MKFPRTKFLRRCLLSSALLASGAVSSAADQAKNTGLLQGLVTGRKAAATSQNVPANQSTTVQAELQKLFQAGQVKISQHQNGTAQPSVRLIQHESETESSGLLRQIFGGSTSAERRAKRLKDRANRGNPQASNRAPSVPKPPPIDFANQQRTQKSATSVNARPVGMTREIAQPPGVPPAETKTNSRFTLKPAAVDEFVSPFIDDESLERKSVMLDLDSLVDRPADRSEAMPITTEGDVVQRLVELPIPLEAPATDPLLPANTLTLPTVDAVLSERLPSSPKPTETAEEQPVIEAENVEVMVIQSKISPTKVVEGSEPADSGIKQPADAENVAVEATQTEAKEKARLSIQEANARRQQQRYLIMSRAGRSGFKGFCPVALRETRMLRDSSTTHAARFGLKTYYFGSDDARMQFEADPARYAPAAGGSDVVLLANTGEEIEGSLDFCLWYRDRLYMFRSRETQAIFSTDPARFANQY